MPKLTLHYFDIAGRGEPIRLILRVAKIPFEDARIPFTDWPQRKPEMPFGQVPVLEIDGKKLPQFHAIIRYVAQLGNLWPIDNEKSAVCDATILGVEEIFNAYKPFYKASDAEKPKVIIASTVDRFKSMLVPGYRHVNVAFLRSPNAFQFSVAEAIGTNDIPPLLKYLDGYVGRYLEKGFVTGSLSAADLVAYQVLTGLKQGQLPGLPKGLPDFDKHYPSLAKVLETVEGVPGVHA